MKKALAGVVAVVASFALVTPMAQAAPTAIVVPAAKKDYSVKKQNRFWNLVKSYEPSVVYGGKRNTISLGIAVCDLLRAGGDMYDLASLVVEADSGDAEDAIIAIIAAAPVVLCPDQGYKFD